VKRIARNAAVSAALALALAAGSAAQMARPAGEETPRAMEAPKFSPAAERVLEQAFLTDEERADLRVFHGKWTAEDLNTPARRALAALTVGSCDDESLRDPATPADLRAEGATRRGELNEALKMLEGVEGVRGARLRAEALEGLGRFEEADAAIEPIVERLIEARSESAAELTEAARALGIRARIRGLPAGDFQSLMDLLGRAQQELDRLYWPAVLEQAQLLYEKDNRPKAAEAAQEVLSLNPKSAEAWALLGRLSVDGFNFGQSERVALELENLVQELSLDRGAVSADAEMLRARAALRQNDPEYAKDRLARALTACPASRPVLALLAGAAAITYDMEQTEALVAEFDEISPGSPLALYEVGRALAENRQYERAAEYLEKASERQPNWADPVIELGLLEMQSGRDTRALSALRRATELDPFNVRARNSLVLVEELATYDTLESEHFIVRYKPGIDEVMARDMLEPLEELHRTGVEAIDFVPEQKTVIELLQDHEWFAVRITGMTGIHTIAASTGPVIAMEAPKIGKRNNGPYDWVRVVRHEYIHTLTLARTNNRIPLWFTEASAVNSEGAPRDYQTWLMLVSALETGGLFDMEEINIAFVRPKKPSDRGQAYAQGHWMYQYIVHRWGERAPLDMMDLYAEGLREKEVMEKVLGIPQEEFLRDFKVWARQDAKAVGMLDEPDMRAMLILDLLSRDGENAELAAALGRLAVTSPFLGPEPGELPGVEIDDALVERLAERWPEHSDVLSLLVQQRLRDAGGEPTESMIPLLERYARARPVDPTPHRHLARLYLSGSTPERAIPHLEFLDEREQNTPAYAVELARRYAALKEWDPAWAKIVRATRIAPFDGSYRELAASVALQRKDYAGAEWQIEALTMLEPDQPVHKQRLERVRQLRERGS